MDMLKDAAAFASACREELTGNILPFWLKHGWDREHGGVYTCLDRDGTLMDPTKSVWFQGRFAYVLSYACNVLGSSDEWLAAAKSTIDFFERHCFDARGRMYFEVAADGTPLRMRRYVFSECFAAIALAEYAKAAGDGAAAERAVDLFRRIQGFMRDPSMMPPKYEPAFAAQGHSLTMILINVATVLKQVSSAPELDMQIDESIDRLLRHFLHPEFKCVLETVGPNGEFIDTIAGRTINPGHAIETSWFLMDVARARGDNALLSEALKILDWSWDWGWDADMGGGIISFRDCRNFPPQCYEQDMKFWWPQCEAVIANLTAYKATGEDRYLAHFRQAAEWAWNHLKDPLHPEWFGYLHRDGTVAQPAKGNLFKGPFHIPRMLVRCAGGDAARSSAEA
ncbi:MAG: AGE family epimerase/isomerase [Kiritimatiellae bacterium]|nr:AGE family epimerase/isomerase [Kiritimatiellia bacterium]